MRFKAKQRSGVDREVRAHRLLTWSDTEGMTVNLLGFADWDSPSQNPC